MSLKIAFVDFWDGFDPNHNFFSSLFAKVRNIQVVHPSECDLLIFSCFGTENLAYTNKKRIFYTGENLRPNYDTNIQYQRNFAIGKCDYSMTFDFSDDHRNIRVPLWMLQIDWFEHGSYGNPQFLIPYNELSNNSFMHQPKTEFCSFVFNSTAPHRYEIIQELSKYKKVDCFGKPHGNWFYGEAQKIAIIAKYKFNICFENSIHPGYYTEKPIHAKYAGCVPVYWSDKQMALDFNSDAFLNLSDFSNIKSLCERIIELDNNDLQYEELRLRPMFSPDQDPIKMLEAITSKIQSVIL